MKFSTAVNLAAMLLGAIVLVLALREVRPSEVNDIMLAVGAWFVVIAAIDVTGVLCDAFAIHAFLRPHVKVSYGWVLGAEFSGLAINRLSPMNSFGEPVKVTMLMRDVPAEHAVSATVMFNLTNIYVALATVAIGVPISLAMLDLSSGMTVAVWSTLAVLFVGAIALALLVRHGPLGSIIDTLATLRIISAERKERWRAKVAGVDSRLRSLGRLQAPGLGRALAGIIASRVINSIGTVVVVHALGFPLSPALVIALLSLGIVITWIANIVPLGLGMAEGATYVLYAVFGAPARGGLVFALVNRMRTLVLASLGMIVMAIVNIAHRRRNT